MENREERPKGYFYIAIRNLSFTSLFCSTSIWRYSHDCLESNGNDKILNKIKYDLSNTILQERKKKN